MKRTNIFGESSHLLNFSVSPPDLMTDMRKQVAQKTTIAHLRASKSLKYFEYVKDIFNWSRAANSAVYGWIQSHFKLF